MSVQQISVFLENKPGTLKKLTSVLAKNNIDLRATSLAETKDFGIARIIVDDALEAVNTLKENDFVASLTSVLAVEIPDEAGGLDKLLEVCVEVLGLLELVCELLELLCHDCVESDVRT